MFACIYNFEENTIEKRLGDTVVQENSNVCNNKVRQVIIYISKKKKIDLQSQSTCYNYKERRKNNMLKFGIFFIQH